jgi:hypothetical protein
MRFFHSCSPPALSLSPIHTAGPWVRYQSVDGISMRRRARTHCICHCACYLSCRERWVVIQFFFRAASIHRRAAPLPQFPCLHAIVWLSARATIFASASARALSNSPRQKIDYFQCRKMTAPRPLSRCVPPGWSAIFLAGKPPNSRPSQIRLRSCFPSCQQTHFHTNAEGIAPKNRTTAC